MIWEFFDKIYCINLDSRPDRWKQAQEEFNKVGITNVFRISGVVAENPATGCHLSHATCFIDAKAEKTNNILIFEDDIEFFPDAYANLKETLKELPDNWDMFYLGGNLDIYPAYQISSHIIKLTGIYATHAYAIKSNLFDTLRIINSDLTTHHNDVTYARDIHPNYNCYLAYPLVAGQRKSYSDIQKIMMDSNQVFQRRVKSNTVWMK